MKREMALAARQMKGRSGCNPIAPNFVYWQSYRELTLATNSRPEGLCIKLDRLQSTLALQLAGAPPFD
ncbi:MAG: hypothetical protein QOD75_1376 [Blastocatellia bacterium]|nr:hypothetical protein [Blastocatellia bacterium]